ncbi:ATP-dependent DNA helicase RecG [Nitrosomonas sp. Nm51]|uniref:ATP-binding protein n=1 Tax=Nitrosomonas sp. Nm51 TaxID=133720 RepID=UPI0008B3051D|nr:ATP-binding protein [Nitrosomonas sp. Nm51]SER46691.1 ATP-dependent DNA helicase RecG [Nitrosomonas sp. Nm51]
MIDKIEISKAEKQKLLNLEEGHFSDLKSIDVSPAKLSKAISAFANAEGGELFIGIEDKTRVWRGFDSIEAANAHIQVFEECFPLGADFKYDFLKTEDEDGLVLKVEVSKTRDLRTATDGKVYLRRGAQSLPVTDSERLTSLKRDKGIISFEAELVNCPEEEVCNSVHIIEFLIEVVPTGEPEAWLKKQLLLQSGKPTVAAVLLFAEEPQAALPKRSGLKIYRYKTSGKEGSRETLDFDPISIEGNLYQQIKLAVDETTKIIESVRIQRMDGLVEVKYPHDAIHEILTNAVIHRDYSITDDIHVRIFDNRIEILSPGTLAGHVTPDNILSERFARNPAIVRLINKFPDPPNKDVGEGLNTAFESMQKLKLKPPVIEQEGGYVKVILKHESLATSEEAILKYLSENENIANREAREICFIESENKMKRILQSLVSTGLLEPVPGRSQFHAAYQLTEAGRDAAKKYT